eukprot:CAMPEP_0117657278 /NCGR_PEP_ID=MMETSP0804-20121206/5246_1 /TAXON_ID=1074897 /ORGANISM="Tetraselmis astigmatica, Strain CCMP880" /LENGTH=383 /DNA_ID=CAMNT_0005463723 /DNA_START=103 /DNA_END=1255 /DNA_ORIENTATION=-
MATPKGEEAEQVGDAVEEGASGEEAGLEVEALLLDFKVELSESVIALCVSPEDHTVAVGTIDDEIHIISREKQGLSMKLEGHPGGVNSVAYLTETVLLSAGEDGTAAVWDLTTGGLLERHEVEGVDADRTPDGHTVSNIVVSEDGKSFAVSAGKSVHIISMEKTELEEERHKVFPPVGAVVEDIKFLASGELIAGYYGGVSIWSPLVGQTGVELPFKGNMLSVSATNDKRWIIAGCHDATVHIWNLQENGNMQELTCGGYEGKVTNCAFDLSNRWMASTGGNRNVIWDFSGSGPAGSMPTIALGHSLPLTSQAWHATAPGSLQLEGGTAGSATSTSPQPGRTQRSRDPGCASPAGWCAWATMESLPWLGGQTAGSSLATSPAR